MSTLFSTSSRRRFSVSETNPDVTRSSKRVKVGENDRIRDSDLSHTASNMTNQEQQNLEEKVQNAENSILGFENRSSSAHVNFGQDEERASEAVRQSGVVYLGRIPHGFYENEMRSYFSQFGTIVRLRLCRNKTTGNSKHYAFIEFSSAEVAQIVAETMNNYILYGHILKCRVLPDSECDEKMWIGANRKWKVPPLSKLRRIKYESKRSIEGWETLRRKENTRRQRSARRWEDLGIDYTFVSSQVSVDEEKHHLAR